MSDYRHQRPNVSSWMDHIGCPAKSRRVIFNAAVDNGLQDVGGDIAPRYAGAFVEIGTEKAPVHLLVPSGPTSRPTTMVQLIQSFTARAIFHRVPTVTKRLWGGVLVQRFFPQYRRSSRA